MSPLACKPYGSLAVAALATLLVKANHQQAEHRERGGHSEHRHDRGLRHAGLAAQISHRRATSACLRTPSLMGDYR